LCATAILFLLACLFRLWVRLRREGREGAAAAYNVMLQQQILEATLEEERKAEEKRKKEKSMRRYKSFRSSIRSSLGGGSRYSTDIAVQDLDKLPEPSPSHAKQVGAECTPATGTGTGVGSEHGDGEEESDEEESISVQSKQIQRMKTFHQQSMKAAHHFKTPPYDDFRRRLIHSTLLLLSIFYLKFNELQFKLFVCVRAPIPEEALSDLPTYDMFLAEDYQTSCYHSAHLGTSIAVAFIIVLYSIGYPLLTLVVLCRAFVTPGSHGEELDGMTGWLVRHIPLLRPRRTQEEQEEEARKNMQAEDRHNKKVLATAKQRAGVEEKDKGQGQGQGDGHGRSVSISTRDLSSMPSSTLLQAYIQHTRIAQFGFLFIEFKRNHFTFYINTFLQNLWIAAASVLIQSIDVQLFMLGICFTLYCVSVAAYLPYEKWRNNLKDGAMHLFLVVQSLALLSVQPGAHHMQLFIALLAVFGVLILGVALRKYIVRCCDGRSLARLRSKRKSAKVLLFSDADQQNDDEDENDHGHGNGKRKPDTMQLTRSKRRSDDDEDDEHSTQTDKAHHKYAPTSKSGAADVHSVTSKRSSLAGHRQPRFHHTKRLTQSTVTTGHGIDMDEDPDASPDQEHDHPIAARGSSISTPPRSRSARVSPAVTPLRHTRHLHHDTRSSYGSGLSGELRPPPLITQPSPTDPPFPSPSPVSPDAIPFDVEQSPIIHLPHDHDHDDRPSPPSRTGSAHRIGHVTHSPPFKRSGTVVRVRDEQEQEQDQNHHSPRPPSVTSSPLVVDRARSIAPSQRGSGSSTSPHPSPSTASPLTPPRAQRLQTWVDNRAALNGSPTAELLQRRLSSLELMTSSSDGCEHIVALRPIQHMQDDDHTHVGLQEWVGDELTMLPNTPQHAHTHMQPPFVADHAPTQPNTSTS